MRTSRRSSAATPPTLDASRMVWAADWSLNHVELPISLPAPVHSPHELCKKAARLVRKYSKARVDDERHHMLLHWALGDKGLVVQASPWPRRTPVTVMYPTPLNLLLPF